jgi:deoxyribodipyrimidine photo-lyase
MKTVIHWFRRDLRVSDNTALSEATRRAERVIPVFILEEALWTGPDVGAARLAFLLRSLDRLRQRLAELGYSLIIRRGCSETEIPKLCLETRAEAVFANRRYEPYAQARDNRVFNGLNALGVGFELFKDAVICEETDLLTKAGRPYTVYSPYARAWRKESIPGPRPALRKIHAGKSAVKSDPLLLDPSAMGHPLAQSIPPAGEDAALAILRRFMSGAVQEYASKRNHPAADGTSQLSPHLRCGTIGIRTILEGLKRAADSSITAAQRQSCDIFLNELIWREFYLQILHNFPHIIKGAFRREFDSLDWSVNREHFVAWCEGRTGYPLVDAAMRSLNKTAWMHNRLRMNVAMFLTKDLLLNWQWGERYFMEKLVDGDLAANNGGWQWSAGTGTDAAPYFRIFNPVLQAKQFDPTGGFIRRWIPELESVPDSLIHAPWEDLSAAKKLNYPPPIVIHGRQRSRCLAMFDAIRKQPGGRPGDRSFNPPKEKGRLSRKT